MVNEKIAARLLRQADQFSLAAGEPHMALVRGLAAAFGIEGGEAHQNVDRVARLGLIDLAGALDDGQNGRVGLRLVIADEFGRSEPVAQGQPSRPAALVAGTLPVLARHGPLTRHGCFIAIQIDVKAAGAKGVLGQVKREAIGVIELEGDLALEHVASLERAGRFVQQGQAPAKRSAEPLFFLAQGLGDQSLGAQKLRIGAAHLADQGGDQTPH